MVKASLEAKIKARGLDFFASIQGETPTIFNKSWWSGKILDRAMRNEDFKVQLFRFIDVLPALDSETSLTRHLEEYFGTEGQDIPAVLKWCATADSRAAKLTAAVLAKTVRSNIRALADQFIIGRNSAEALQAIDRLRKQGFAFTVDILGEATVSAEEENLYQQGYLDLLAALGSEQQAWQGLAADQGESDWGHAPRINLAVKPTTLYSQTDPADFEGSVDAIVRRFIPIAKKAQEVGAFLCIDMEQFRYKDIIIEVYKRLRSAPEFRQYPHLGLALQSYLRQTDADLDGMLAWAGREKLPVAIRLVKGAYWDYEMIVARQNGWPAPVFTAKAETDAAFERQAQRILASHELCHLACASHNIRTIAAVMETAAALEVPEERYEFQVLYGMAEPVRKGLLRVAGRVRLYCPYGEVLPGMAYLVRRLLENTANESFLRQSFVEETDVDRLLESPEAIVEQTVKQARASEKIEEGGRSGAGTVPPFRNEAAADFTRSEIRLAFAEAIAGVRAGLGRTYPLRISGDQVETAAQLASVNPANPSEVVGRVCLAGREQVGEAVAAAREAFPAWRDSAPEERAACLFRAAGIMRRDIFRLAAWQILEVGKQWDQAHADVAEGIDFLEYYGREMLRLAEPRRLGGCPGEVNQYFYQPRGVAAVIAPWNFPLAIGCGMCAAALVAGNCVLYKPSSLAAVVGARMADIFYEAGLPAGVFHFVPGRSEEIGDYLVEHPDVSLIAFTGSREVGLRINQKAAALQAGQANVKRVIAEMGGKNAIIIDDDADIDAAVVQVLRSAFGYQGQKCSACSRVIVVEAVYDTFVRRLVEGAKSLKIGPAEDPANFMGPVVDEAAQKKILNYIDLAGREGEILLLREVPGKGYYVPLTIVNGITTAHRLAWEEIFGPVLAVMRAVSFEEALAFAASTPYALTGGVFSRSPRHLAQAREQFRVGNLYLNRGITGALVGRQPFGGFKMSGIGSKAGGPDYLLQFMEPRTVTENTMRRGFAPLA